MSTTHLPTPTSHVRFGIARVDITPPVGIYHRVWGAARHDRATGIHRPLAGDVLVFAAPDPSEGSGSPMVRVHLDLVGLARADYHALVESVAGAALTAPERVTLAFSHSHSAGFFLPNREGLPGGELIRAYLDGLRSRLQDAAARAAADVREALIGYGTGRCAMNANRDYWDEEDGGYACGFNPDVPGDDTVLVARVTDFSGEPRATLVNYGCHPTTLAWENTLLSPDYVGAMRETVERDTGVPCVFALGACGDLGPRHGMVGDPAAADRNGRQLAYAALSALESLPPAGTDFHYTGRVVSGATLGTWAYRPLTPERWAAVRRFDGGAGTVDLPLRPSPDTTSLEAEVESWEAERLRAEGAGDPAAARDAGARAERARRWLGRISDLPPGPDYDTRLPEYPMRFSVARMGDAVWVACGGEPYSAIQVELRRRFPRVALVFSPLAGEIQVAYLLPRDRYGKGLYQEEPSILSPGCLELLTEAIASRIEQLFDR